MTANHTGRSEDRLLLRVDCPECGHVVDEWCDCPNCGWYDSTAWEKAVVQNLPVDMQPLVEGLVDYPVHTDEDDDPTLDEIEERLADLEDRKARVSDATEHTAAARDSLVALRQCEDDIVDEELRGMVTAAKHLVGMVDRELGQVDYGIYYERDHLKQMHHRIEREQRGEE